MIDKELIPKIEEALGFKLYPAVIEYITTGNYNFINTRKQGKTIAYMLNQILGKQYTYIEMKDLKSTNKYTDIINPKPYYNRMYFKMFMDCYSKLEKAGFNVVKLVDGKGNIIKPRSDSNNIYIGIDIDTEAFDVKLKAISDLFKEMNKTFDSYLSKHYRGSRNNESFKE